jgi:diguanylate cyclase (GGDEF)-like protein
LRAIGRGDDRVARLGGDEFAVILADVDRDYQVRAAEARVRAAFVEPFVLGDLSASVGASVGGVVWPEDGRTVNQLVRRADAAMYQDKAEHRRTSREHSRELAPQNA